MKPLSFCPALTVPTYTPFYAVFPAVRSFIYFFVCLVILIGATSPLAAQNSQRSTSDNIGIGTPNPGTLLEVHMPTSLPTTAPFAQEAARFSTMTGNYSQLRIFFLRNSNGTDWASSSTRLQAGTDVTNQGYLEFNPPIGQYGIALGTDNDGTGRNREIMRLMPLGNVGIGTGAPGARLDVLTPYTTTNGAADAQLC
jgi:hypothetical protein